MLVDVRVFLGQRVNLQEKYDYPVYGSFLLFAKRAEKKYGVPARDLLVELGRRGMVGGQEDMIEDTALTMARERGLLRAKTPLAA